MREPQNATAEATDQSGLINAFAAGSPVQFSAVEAKSDELVTQRLLLADAPGLTACGTTIPALRRGIASGPCAFTRLQCGKLAPCNGTANSVTRTGRIGQARSKANGIFGTMQRASPDSRIRFGAFCSAASVLPTGRWLKRIHDPRLSQGRGA
jgi:hypothetical protein